MIVHGGMHSNSVNVANIRIRELGHSLTEAGSRCVNISFCVSLSVFKYIYISLYKAGPSSGAQSAVAPHTWERAFGVLPFFLAVAPGVAGAFGVLPFFLSWVGLGDGLSPFCHWLGQT